MYEVIEYKTQSNNCPYQDYLYDLARAKDNTLLVSTIKLYVKMLKEYGFQINEKFNKKAAKIVDKENGIYELRPKKTRVLYFFKNDDQQYVLLHAFTKKTNKTPKSEIDKAIKEKKDYMNRFKRGMK